MLSLTSIVSTDLQISECTRVEEKFLHTASGYTETTEGKQGGA